MDETEIIAKVTKYIRDEFLNGIDDQELDGFTPLLGRGILDSLRVMLLLTYIRNELGVDISPAEVDPQNLKDIRTLAKMVRGLPLLQSNGVQR